MAQGDFRGRRGRTSEAGVGLGWAWIVAPLTLGFLVSLALAYEALDAGRRHRATARSAAREQAGFAAYLITSSVERRLNEALLYGFYPIDLAMGREGDPLPGPDALRVEPESSRCEAVIPAAQRRFFRFDPRTGRVWLDGPADPMFERWIASRFAADPPDAPAGGFLHEFADLAGDRRLIGHRRWVRDGTPVVYGFESCWRTRTGDAFAEARSGTMALSPALVGDTPNDSLFDLAARSADGDLVHGEAWTRPETELYGDGSFYGTAALSPATAFAGVEVRVTLRPSVAERLVAGGLPRSRLPLALALVTLSAALLGVAVRQLRRGHELVSLRARFVRNVSHELRTPLQQILLFTDLLRSGRLERESDRAKALDIMHAETHRLIGLVRNVLLLSSAEEPAPRLAELDLASAAEETVDAFRPLAAGRRVDIRVETDGRPRVRADPDALKRVLINLLDNAVKYGPDGQTVRVDVARDDTWGSVTVTDSGPGIPAGDRERIWEDFGRLEREETGATAGSGIGLSIARRIVDSMDGEIEVLDGSPPGSRFVVRLPLARVGS